MLKEDRGLVHELQKRLVDRGADSGRGSLGRGSPGRSNPGRGNPGRGNPGRGSGSTVEFRPNIGLAEKLDVLRSFSVLSVPATYGESFGLYLCTMRASPKDERPRRTMP